MRLNEKYKNYFNIMGESGTPTYYYTLWTQLIKSSPEVVSNYCPAILDSSNLSDDDIRALDIYLHTHYGMRNVLNWFGSLDVGTSNNEGATPTQQTIRANLAHTVFMVYGSKWQTLLEVLGIYSKIAEEYKYNPIENVFEIIDETVDTKDTGWEKTKKKGSESDSISGKIIDSKVGTETNSKAGEITETDNGNETVGRYYNGGGVPGFDGLTTEKHLNHTITDEKSAFNDGAGYQADKKQTFADVTGSCDKEVVKGGYTDSKGFTNRSHKTKYGTDATLDADAKDVTETLSFENRKDKREFKDYKATKSFEDRFDKTIRDLKNEMERNYKRHGNIGVASSSKMLMEEIETRRFLIFREMCEDLMGFISSPVYS